MGYGIVSKDMKTRFFSLIFPLFIFMGVTSCAFAQTNSGLSVQQKYQSFTLPSIPVTLIEPAARIEYLVQHYWENFDFSDTDLILHPEITEQAFVDFISILPSVSSNEKIDKSMVNLMESSSANRRMFTYFVGLAEKYLYDPNSPLRNEEYYIPVLKYMVSSPRMDEAHKIRPRHQLKMVMKNRPGSIAMDFKYTTSSGTVARMSSIKADYTVLFFNNPDCLNCKQVKDYMKDSVLFNRMTRTNSKPLLRILAIYPDADLTSWKRADYPDIMINSYDAGQSIVTRELYDLKASPTLYLLDKDKRVILKDVTVEEIGKWLDKLL